MRGERMRHGGIVAALIAGLCLAAAAPAGAESIAPEFGRCVKAPKGETGAGYYNPGCTTPAASGAKYHWLAGPGAKPGFKATTGTVALTLATPGVKHATPVIQCAASAASGEFTGVASESLELVLTGCKMSSADCESAGAAAGEIAFFPLEGTPNVARSTQRGEAFMRWSPAIGGTLASFECGGTEVTIAASMLHVVRDDKMVAAEPEKLRVYKAGTQEPECGEPCEPGEEPETSIGGGPATLSGLAATGAQANEEKIELRTFIS